VTDTADCLVLLLLQQPQPRQQQLLLLCYLAAVVRQACLLLLLLLLRLLLHQASAAASHPARSLGEVHRAALAPCLLLLTSVLPCNCYLPHLPAAAVAAREAAPTQLPTHLAHPLLLLQWERLQL
jgi:hypothetical protein